MTAVVPTPELMDRVRVVLVKSLVLDGLDPQEIADDASLRDELGLDSVDALELVLGLEQEFGIKIDGQGMDRDHFQTVSTLATFVAGEIAASGPRG